jgi:DNA-binding CsgD family transcriptional regulator
MHAVDTSVGCLLAYFVGGDCLALADATAQLAVQPQHARAPVGFLGSGFAALMHGLVGKEAEARRFLADLTPVLEQLGPRTVGCAYGVPLAATAVWELGAADYAARYQRLLRDLVAAGVGPSPLGPHELMAARMSALSGDLTRARTQLARARSALERDRRRHLLAIAGYEEALILARAGTADHAQVPALLETALAEFRALGMAVWERRALALREQLPANRRNDRAARRSYPDGLTAREVEVLALLAARRSDQEIAEALVLSVRTVGRHLSNIYNKLDVNDRRAAREYAVRTGLAAPS